MQQHQDGLGCTVLTGVRRDLNAPGQAADGRTTVSNAGFKGREAVASETGGGCDGDHLEL